MGDDRGYPTITLALSFSCNTKGMSITAISMLAGWTVHGLPLLIVSRKLDCPWDGGMRCGHTSALWRFWAHTYGHSYVIT